MQLFPIQIKYRNTTDKEIKVRLVVPFPDVLMQFSTGNTCITGYDPNAEDGKGGIRRFECDRIEEMATVSFPVAIPSKFEHYYAG